MNYGQGSIGFTNGPGAGGGGGVSGANNGLSVVAAHVQLGGNPLLHDSTFDLANFLFSITNGGSSFKYFLLDPTNDAYSLGDIDDSNNGTFLQIDDLNRRINGMQSSNLGLQLDFGNFLFYLGDVTGFVNGTKLAIDDLAKLAQIVTNGGGMLSLDQNGAQYKMGDLNGSRNGTEILIDDLNHQFFVQTQPGTNVGLLIDLLNLDYAMGDVNAVGNGTALNISDGNKRAIIADIAGQMLYLDQGASLYAMGDISGVANGTQINLN